MLQKLLDYVESKKPLVILAGAGISVGSGVPLASEIVQMLQMQDKTNNSKLQMLDPSLTGAYAAAMDHAFQGANAAENRRAFLDQLLTCYAPSETHHRIAELYIQGYVSGLITTNFDRFLETALYLRSGRPIHVHINGETLLGKQLRKDAHHVVKLHGDLLFEDMGNLKDEMDGRVDSVMKKAVNQLLNDSALLVLGYGCEDPNVRCLLESVAASPNGLNGGFFFVAYRIEEAEKPAVKEIMRIMSDYDKPAVVITGIDLGTEHLKAEVILKRIMDHVKLTFLRNHPFGFGLSDLPIYQRIPMHCIPEHQDVPVPTKKYKYPKEIRELADLIIQRFNEFQIIVYVDDNCRRRKFVLAETVDRLGDRAAYFTDRLAPSSSRQALWNRLNHFTARHLGTYDRRLDVECLFKINQGAVIVWDDLDLSNVNANDGYARALRNLFPSTVRMDIAGTNPILILATFDQNNLQIIKKLLCMDKGHLHVKLTQITAPVTSEPQIIATSRLSPERLEVLRYLHRAIPTNLFEELFNSDEVAELENKGLIVQVAGRVLVLLESPDMEFKVGPYFSTVGRKLKDWVLRKTPIDSHIAFDAYQLLFKAECWEEAWILFRIIEQHMVKETGSEIKRLMEQWWGKSNTDNPVTKLSPDHQLDLLIMSQELGIMPKSKWNKITNTLPFIQRKMLYTIDETDRLSVIKTAREMLKVGRKDYAIRLFGLMLALIIKEISYDKCNIVNLIEELHLVYNELLPIEKAMINEGVSDTRNPRQLSILFKDNLANLYREIGDMETSNRIRRELRKNPLLFRQTVDRAKLFGNQLVLELNEGRLDVAESMFVISCQAAASDSINIYRENVYIIGEWAEDLIRKCSEEIDRLYPP